MAVILITHDLGVVAEYVDRVLVMYAGRVVESAGVHPTFEQPLHPYTEGLLGSIPALDDERPAPAGDPGHGAEPVRPAARLPLRAALPLREAGLRRVPTRR